jgi:hypothetical protein
LEVVVLTILLMLALTETIQLLMVLLRWVVVGVPLLRITLQLVVYIQQIQEGLVVVMLIIIPEHQLQVALHNQVPHQVDLVIVVVMVLVLILAAAVVLVLLVLGQMAAVVNSIAYVQVQIAGMPLVAVGVSLALLVQTVLVVITPPLMVQMV